MEIGAKRTAIARLAAMLGFACGMLGLSAGLTDHEWKLGAIGWFSGGGLLIVIALFVLIDGAIAFRKTQVIVAHREAEPGPWVQRS